MTSGKGACVLLFSSGQIFSGSTFFLGSLLLEHIGMSGMSSCHVREYSIWQNVQQPLVWSQAAVSPEITGREKSVKKKCHSVKIETISLLIMLKCHFEDIEEEMDFFCCCYCHDVLF